MQVLMDISTKKGYSVLFKFNSSNQLTHATFVSPYSLKLIQTGFVLLFDCTYKTNRYKLPLLHVVGITPLNTSFTMCVSN